MVSRSLSRRTFIKGSTVAGLTVASAGSLAAVPKAKEQAVQKQKNAAGMLLLNDRPLNMETPMHLLDDEITPVDKMFVRNNGLIPDSAYSQSLDSWRLTIDGAVDKALVLSFSDLLSRFKVYQYHMVLECGGNGRAGYHPPAKGNQWTYGAVACPMWTGVRLADVLAMAGVKKSAVYIGYYGSDRHISGDPKKVPISRGFPISKGLDAMTLLAFQINGKPLPPEHGYPLRIVCPGYPGSASGKWLKRIWVRDKVHDGPKMEAPSYSMPKYPVAPGQNVPLSDYEIIGHMPVKSLITSPRSGTTVGSNVEARGWAWTSAESVSRVDVTVDFGRTWQRADLKTARNRYGWQRWRARLQIRKAGYYEVWARATDSTGEMQPMVVPGWNPKGYLNNAMPRIAIDVGASV